VGPNDAIPYVKCVVKTEWCDQGERLHITEGHIENY